MSHSRKRAHGSTAPTKKNTKEEHEQQEEVPASQDPMAIITDPIESEPKEEQSSTTLVVESESAATKKPRISVTYENKEAFQPLSSTFITEVKEDTHTSTAMVVHRPQQQQHPHSQFVVQFNGQSIEFKRDKTGWGNLIKKLIEQEAAKVGYLTMGMKLMLQDIRVSTYYYFKFFPPTHLEFSDDTFKDGDGQDVPTVGVHCNQLQVNFFGLEFDGAVQRAMFAELAPLGNWHPRGKDKRPDSLKKAKNKCSFSLEDSLDHPEFNQDMREERQWLEVVRELGLEFIKWDPNSKPYKLLTRAGFKPNGTDEERAVYSSEFDTHLRPTWKVNKKEPGKYPFSYMASNHTFKLCTKKEAYDIDTKKVTYIVPGNIQEIKDFQRKTLPKKVLYKFKDDITGEKKEVMVQQRQVHFDVPIFEAKTGRFIFMHERKEIHAYEDAEQTQFIEPADRKRDIEDREWVIPRKRIVFTFKDEDDTSPWTIGMAQKLVRIQKHLPPDVHVSKERVWDEKTAPLEKLPQGRAIMDEEEEQGFLKRIQEQQRAEMDTAMLAYDMPQTAAAVSSTDSSQSQIHSTHQQSTD